MTDRAHEMDAMSVVRMLVDDLIHAMVVRAQKDKKHLSETNLKLAYQSIFGGVAPKSMDQKYASAFDHLFGFGAVARQYLDRREDKNLPHKGTLRPIRRDRHIDKINKAVTLPLLAICHDLPVYGDEPTSWIGFLLGAYLAVTGHRHPDHDKLIQFIQPSSPALIPYLGIASAFRPHLQEFLEAYFGEKDRPVPFGGRDVELELLTSWLCDPTAPPRMLVTARTGLGKTALLLEWLRSIQHLMLGPSRWQVLYLPISILADTIRPGVFFRALAQRLHEITDKELPSAVQAGPDAFRQYVRDRLTELARSDGRFLLVIDGIDEALHQSFDPLIIPTKLPSTFRLLVSARLQIGDEDASGWINRLNWVQEEAMYSPPLELALLSRAAVADVFVKYGAPKDVETRESALFGQLVKLTAGEPITVRSYAEDLWGTPRTDTPISLADLANLDPGFSAYFRRWLELQEPFWNEEEESFEHQLIYSVLSIFAFAYGRLETGDIRQLLSTVYHMHGVAGLERRLRPLRRFVIGTGRRERGYLIGHPKLSQILREQWFGSEDELIRNGYADWVLNHAKQANVSTTLLDVSAYALLYGRTHFEDANVPKDYWLELIENGWRLAWEKFGDAYRGYATDIEHAWAALRRIDPGELIWAQWRCALILSSIGNVGKQIPLTLLVAAVRHNLLPVTQAIYFVETGDGWSVRERLTTLQQLAEACIRRPLEFDERMLAAALSILSVHGRPLSSWDHLDALEIVGPSLTSESREDLLGQALSVYGTEMREPNVRSNLKLSALGRHMSTQQVISFVQDIPVSNLYWRSYAFESLHSLLQPDQRRKELDAIIEAIKYSNERYNCEDAIKRIAPYLDPDQAADLLSILAPINDKEQSLSAFEALMPTLSPKHVSNLLRTIRRRLNPSACNDVLRRLLIHLSEVEVRSTIAILEGENREIASELRLLLPVRGLQKESASSDEREAPTHSTSIPAGEIVTKVMSLAKGYCSDLQFAERYNANAYEFAWDQKDEFFSLAASLSHDQCDEVLEKARDVTEFERAVLIDWLSQHLAIPQVEVALCLALDLNPRYCALALSGLAPRLNGSQVARALSASKSIHDEKHRVAALAACIPYISPDCRSNVFEQAFTLATQVRGGIDCAEAIRQLVRFFEPPHWEKLFNWAMALGDDGRAPRILLLLAPHLTDFEISMTLPRILEVRDEALRAHILSQLVPRMTDHDIALTFASSLGMPDTYPTADLLKTLAPRLTDQQLVAACRFARTLSPRSPRVTILEGIAHRLSQVDFDEAFSSILEASSLAAIPFELRTFVHRLSLEQIGEASSAIATRPTDSMLYGFNELASCLSEEQVSKVRERVMSANGTPHNAFVGGTGLDQRTGRVTRVKLLISLGRMADGVGQDTQELSDAELVREEDLYRSIGEDLAADLNQSLYEAKLADRLFAAMSINDTHWDEDRKRAIELAKIIEGMKSSTNCSNVRTLMSKHVSLDLAFQILLEGVSASGDYEKRQILESLAVIASTPAQVDAILGSAGVLEDRKRHANVLFAVIDNLLESNSDLSRTAEQQKLLRGVNAALLEIACRFPREDALLILRHCLPLITLIAGASAAHKVVTTIRDVGAWYP